MGSVTLKLTCVKPFGCPRARWVHDTDHALKGARGAVQTALLIPIHRQKRAIFTAAFKELERHDTLRNKSATYLSTFKQTGDHEALYCNLLECFHKSTRYTGVQVFAILSWHNCLFVEAHSDS
jgi:hypothetical protein